jgi:hypothetical protein
VLLCGRREPANHARICGRSLGAIAKFLCDAGRTCSLYQDKAFYDLPCRRIQCDEIWSFVYAKDKNAPEDLKVDGEAGDVWTWTAHCADTKLVPGWAVGPRDGGMAYHFIHDLAKRLRNRVQMTTDGHKAYLNAVEDAFGTELDYAMLIMVFGNGTEHEGAQNYSPGMCMGSRVAKITGKPEYDHISTSYVERQNLTLRMNMPGSLDLRRPFQRSWRTTKRQSPFTSCITTFAAFMPPCGSPRRWRLVWQPTCETLRKSLG